MKRSRGIFGGLFTRKPKKEKARQDKPAEQAERTSNKPPFSAEGTERYKIGDLIINRHEVYRVITGGFGVVYICYDHHQQAPFAIKGFKEKYALSDEDVKNFEREAYEWAQLEIHQNIVRAHFVDVIGGRPFIFMEFVAGAEDIGSSLAGWIKHRRLDPERALKMATEIANGMEYAYRKRGLIHRDLKPDNVLVTGDGIAKITDFGLAKVVAEAGEKSFTFASLGERAGTSLSVSGRACGTPPYMSPEQWIDANKADTRSDIYSFGCLLYEMLTGYWPFYPTNAITKWEAMEELKAKHLEERPKNPICLKRDVPVELDRLVMKCLEKKPDHRYAGFKKVRDELAQIYRETSGKEIKLELTSQELEAGELNNKGGSLSTLGKYDEALSCFDNAIELDPKEALVWNNKGVTLHRLGKCEEALSCYARAIEIDPELVLTWINKGASLGELGRHKEALGCFDRALDIDQNDALIWSNKGGSLAALGRHKEALPCYERAIELDPKEALAWNNKGVTLHRLGKCEEALSCYARAIEIDPRFAEAWSGKGGALIDLGRHEEALNCFDRALEIKPSLEKARKGRQICLEYLGRSGTSEPRTARLPEVQKLGEEGVLWLSLGMYEEALAYFNRALQIDPKDAEIWSDKGISLDGLGRHKEAIACYDRAIEIDPRYAPAWYNKGISLFGLGNYDEALSYFEETLRIDARDADAWSHKGASLAGLGRRKEALSCYDKAIEIDSRHTRAWYNKGILLLELGDYDEALSCFEKVLKINPFDESAREGRRMCLENLGRSS